MPCDGVAVLKAELKKRDEEVQQILDILNEVQIPVVMESVMGDAVIRFSVSIPLPQGGFFPVRVAVTPGGQVTAITRTGTFEQGRQMLLQLVEKTLKARGVRLEGVKFEAHVHQGVSPQLAYNQKQVV